MQLLAGLTLQLAEMTEAIHIDETTFVHHADPLGQAQHTVPALHASQALNPEMNLSNGEHGTVPLQIATGRQWVTHRFSLTVMPMVWIRLQLSSGLSLRQLWIRLCLTQHQKLVASSG